MKKPSSGLMFSGPEIKEKEGLHLRETLEPEIFLKLPDGVALRKPLELSLEFSVGEENILLEGSFEGRWEFSCSRCLSPSLKDFKLGLEETYPAAQTEIDVLEEISQALILSFPFKPLCRQDCAGLCPRCGENLNEGPCRCAK